MEAIASADVGGISEDTAVLDAGRSGEIVEALCRGTRNLRIATAYLTLPGYKTIAKHLRGSILRLLLGSKDAVRSLPEVFDYFLSSIKRGVPSAEKRLMLIDLEEKLLTGATLIRAFDVRYRAHLHAKVYLFDDRAAYVTSANLTGSGLHRNIEGGHLVTAPDAVRHYGRRFDELFAESIDLLPQVVEAIESTWAFHPPVSPYLFYLRVLIELFGEVPELPDADVVLADYQRMIVGSVLQVLRDTGRGLLVSPTGTGKTIMAAYAAAALLPHFVRNVFVLCPNSSLAARWVKDFRRFSITCQPITHGIVQGKGHGSVPSDNAEAFHDLIGKLRSTDLVIVDECHAFRNPMSNGFTNLQQLLAGSTEGGRPKCLLVTATPISVGLQDLNHQLTLIGNEQFHTLADISSSRLVVNVTRPFIEDHFGTKRDPDQPPLLTFGAEQRSFPKVVSRKTIYPFRLGALIEAIRQVQYRLARETRRSAPRAQLVLAGVPPPPERTDYDDLGPLIRLMLMRAAESSPRAVDRMLARMERNPQRSRLLDGARFKESIAAVRALIPKPEDDAKLSFLLNRMSELALERKVLIFTNFVGTADYLHDQLRQMLSEHRIGIITGDVRGHARRQVLHRFAPRAQGRRGPRRKDDIDMLIATDAIAEGENLQDASVLINYDLHWTPLRLIQRVGRLERPTREFREVAVWNFFPDGRLFEELLQLWGRLADRSVLYEQLASTQVLEDPEPIPEETNERDHGLVRGIYDEESYENLLREYMPASRHLVQFAQAKKDELSRARALPDNCRAVKASSASGTFVVLKHEKRVHCVVENAERADGIETSPADAAHEALLPIIVANRDEIAPREPSDSLHRLGRVIEAWATRNGAEPDEVQVICSEALVATNGGGGTGST